MDIDSSDEENNVPGPGAYDVNLSPQESNWEGHQFFGSSEQRFKNDAQKEFVPGPGAYSSQEHEPRIKSKGLSMFMKDRNIECFKGTDLPSPADYDPYPNVRSSLYFSGFQTKIKDRQQH